MLLANAFASGKVLSGKDNDAIGAEDQDLGFKFIIQDREVVVGMGEKVERSLDFLK